MIQTREVSALNLTKNLVSLKNRAEIMLELAYSALTLRDNVLANQVYDLYTEFSKIATQASAQIPKKNKAFIDNVITYWTDVARTSVKLSNLAKGKVPLEVKESLQKADHRVIEELVHFSSFFVGRSVGNLSVRTHTKARIVCVKRNDSWLFGIDKNFVFHAKDLIIAVGTAKSAKLLAEAVNRSILRK